MTISGSYFGYIYETHDTRLGKFYIGKRAKGIFDKRYFGSGTDIRKALERNGSFDFTVKPIRWVFSEKEIRNSEEELIIEYFRIYGPDRMYNISSKSGGVARHSEISKLKLSEAGKKVWESEEHRKHFSFMHRGENNWNYGRYLSKEHREAVGRGNKGKLLGRKLSQFTIDKISKSQKKLWTPEKRKSYSERMTELMSRDDLKSFLQSRTGSKNPFYGKRHSEESKKANSLAHTGSNSCHFGTKWSVERRQKVAKAWEFKRQESARINRTGDKSNELP